MDNLMNTAKLIIHICVIVHACVNTCNIHVCLTWELENSSITFKCKVNHLRLNVAFYNPANQNQGRCIIPIPTTTCFPLHNNSLSQDKLTNTTTLTVKSSMVHNNGTWKCTHGTNVSEAIVKIPVLKKDAKRLLNMQPHAHICWKNTVTWTAVGFVPVVILCAVLSHFVYMCFGDKAKRKCFFNRKRYTIYNPKRKCSFNRKRFTMYHRIMLPCRIIAGLAICIIPLMVGFFDTECKSEKKGFAILGLVCAFVVTIRISEKKKDIATSLSHECTERKAISNDNPAHDLDDEGTRFVEEAGPSSERRYSGMSSRSCPGRIEITNENAAISKAKFWNVNDRRQVICFNTDSVWNR